MIVFARRGVGRIDHLAFTPNGGRLVAGGLDRVVCFAVGGDVLWTSEYGSPVYGLAVTADGGRALALRGSGVDAFSVADGKMWPVCGAGSISGLTAGPDDLVLFDESEYVRPSWRSYLVATDAPPGRPAVERWRLPGGRGPAAFLPGGGLLVAAATDDAARTAAVWLVDAATGTTAATLACPNQSIDRLAAHSDRVAAVSRASLFVWSLADPARPPTRVTTGNGLHFTGLAFTPDGRHLLATSNDHTVRVYDAATGKLARTLDWAVGKLRSVAVSPDGTLVAAGAGKGQVVVWDFDG